METQISLHGFCNFCSHGTFLLGSPWGIDCAQARGLGSHVQVFIPRRGWVGSVGKAELEDLPWKVFTGRPAEQEDLHRKTFTGRPARKGSVIHLSQTVHGGLRSHLPEMQTVKPTKSWFCYALSCAPAVVSSVGNKNTPPWRSLQLN